MNRIRAERYRILCPAKLEFHPGRPPESTPNPAKANTRFSTVRILSGSSESYVGKTARPDFWDVPSKKDAGFTSSRNQYNCMKFVTTCCHNVQLSMGPQISARGYYPQVSLRFNTMVLLISAVASEFLVLVSRTVHLIIICEGPLLLRLFRFRSCGPFFFLRIR